MSDLVENIEDFWEKRPEREPSQAEPLDLTDDWRQVKCVPDYVFWAIVPSYHSDIDRVALFRMRCFGQKWRSLGHRRHLVWLVERDQALWLGKEYKTHPREPTRFCLQQSSADLTLDLAIARMERAREEALQRMEETRIKYEQELAERQKWLAGTIKAKAALSRFSFLTAGIGIEVSE